MTKADDDADDVPLQSDSQCTAVPILINAVG